MDPDPLSSEGSPAGLSPRGEQLAATRPADATDRCVLPDGTVLTGPDTYAPGGPCDVAYPTHADPRRVAGAPITGATLACTLVPVDPAGPDYPVALSAAQADRLRAVFPDGVCDWSSPGRGQVPLIGVWGSYD